MNFSRYQHGKGGDTATDFPLGAGGDLLDLSDISCGDPADPLSGGFLSFDESGADTLVRMDVDGGVDEFTTYITLLKVHLTTANTANYIVDV